LAAKAWLKKATTLPKSRTVARVVVKGGYLIGFKRGLGMFP
jgi:hypothetical protein